MNVHGESGKLQDPNPITCTFSFGFAAYATNFNDVPDGQLPAGTTGLGTTPPTVTAGVLHITDRVNSQANYWSVPLAGTFNLDRLQAKWKNYLEGLGGADGMSFNAGVTLGTGFTPEEGGPNGLAVTVDTFDNGGGEVGTEVRW